MSCYFEKTCRVNRNGKVSGYHKRGKVDEDGKVHLFVDDKYGNEDDIKRINDIYSMSYKEYKYLNGTKDYQKNVQEYIAQETKWYEKHKNKA